MPEWAQIVGEILPLTHFLGIVRGIMLKGNSFAEMQTGVMGLMLVVAMGIALMRFRTTLD